jgi:P-type Ca2+ transporter type 2C
MLTAVFRINVALTPLQLLWLNLLTDGLMGLGLGVEPPESDTMRHPPRKPDNPVFDRPLIVHVSWIGILIAFITLALGATYLDPTQPHNNTWQTIIFTTLGFTQIGHALGLRATGRSPFSLTSNPLMTVVTLATIGLQLFVIYVPFMKQFFELTPLALPDLAIAIVLGSITFVGVQIENRLRKRGEQ